MSFLSLSDSPPFMHAERLARRKWSSSAGHSSPPALFSGGPPGQPACFSPFTTNTGWEYSELQSKHQCYQISKELHRVICPKGARLIRTWWYIAIPNYSYLSPWCPFFKIGISPCLFIIITCFFEFRKWTRIPL